MQGNLENSNLADILFELYLNKRSGILRISQSDVRKSIYLLEGAVVFAHSNQKYDRLGETLLRLGKITLEEFEMASREVIDKGKRLGQALCDLGFISIQEVNSSVHYQLQQIAYSLFDWDSGEFEFIERERPVFEDIMIDVSTPSLIVDGIRNITNPVVLERSYQKNEAQVLLLTHDAPRMPRSDLDFGEETILACVDGVKTIEGVRQLAHLARIEFDRALYSLLLCGMLQLPKKGEQAAQKEPLKTQQKPESGIQKQASFTTQKMEGSESNRDAARLKTLSEEEMRRLIAFTAIRFRAATDEEILSVLPDSTTDEINRAYADLTSQFHAPYYSENRFLNLKSQLQNILDRLTSAHDRLIAKAQSQKPLQEVGIESLQPEVPTEVRAASDPKSTNMESPRPMVTPAKESSQLKDAQREPISEIQARVRTDPGNTTLWRRLGKRFYETGKPHEGEKCLLRALELEPQSVENHFALAEFYQSLGLKIKAFKHLNIILQIQPNNKQAMDMLNVKTRKPLYEIEH